MMGGSYVGNAASFLIDTLFGLYILVVMLRFLLQTVRADFYNPVSQFVVKATQPPLRALRRFIPGMGGIDVASLVLLLVLQFGQLWLTTRVAGYAPAAGGLLVFAVAELLKLALNVFTFAIIIQIVLSWLSPGSYNPVTGLLHSLTEPLLGPARRLLPPMGGLDLSPIPVLIALQLVRILLIAPLHDVGRSLM